MVALFFLKNKIAESRNMTLFILTFAKILTNAIQKQHVKKNRIFMALPAHYSVGQKEAVSKYGGTY